MKPIYISPEKASARFDDESNITPFWLSNIMYRESACFIRKGGRIRRTAAVFTPAHYCRAKQRSENRL